MRPDELSLFRYRGNGCPGPTRLETKDGRSFELTYQEMWEDEATWRIQPRCKICPDAIGESADLAASDVWPGGGPTGEDAGFNGIIVRTRRGLELYRAALAAGAIAVEPRHGRLSRFRWFPAAPGTQETRRVGALGGDEGRGSRGSGNATTCVLEECARLNTVAENLEEARGARRRARQGRLGEPPATER